MAVIELCKPEYAAELLSSDNTRLVSRLFREKIAEVMAIATRETEAILNQALAR